MGFYNDFLKKNTTNNDVFVFVILGLVVLYLFTTVINASIGHLLAVIIVIIIVLSMIDVKNDTITDFNRDLQNKLEGLSDNPEDIDHMHLDADLINLFNDVKIDFHEYHDKSYDQALQSANALLRIRAQTELKLCSQPIVPDLLKRLDVETLEIKLDDKCDSVITNIYEMFQSAEIQSKLCLNYLHTFIYTIPSHPVTHAKHKQMMDRAHVLLKRNTDIILDIYEKHKKPWSSPVNDYNTWVAFNKHDGKNGIIDNDIDSTFNIY